MSAPIAALDHQERVCDEGLSQADGVGRNGRGGRRASGRCGGGARPHPNGADAAAPGAPARAGRDLAGSAAQPAAQPAAPAAPTAAPPAGAQPAPPVPTRTEILNFENWVVTCKEFAEGPKTRVCSATLQIAQQNTNQVVFSWTIGFDNAKQMVAVMQMPTGVIIPPGVELRVGKVPPHKLAFASCDNSRCIATTPMDANLLREMTTVPTAEAVVQGSQGGAVTFTIQMKGFDKAYAVLSPR